MEAVATMEQAGLAMAAGVERARRGDEDAARGLVAELYPLVMKIVRAHRPRQTDPEDLAQTVFARVFTYLDQFSGEVPFAHWVSRIAVNTCLNALRAEARRREVRWADLDEAQAEVVEKVLVLDRGPDPAQSLAARDLAGQLLEMLSPQDRLLLTWLDLEERTVADVRQRTGWSTAAIKVRAFRARRKLRQQLARLVERF